MKHNSINPSAFLLVVSSAISISPLALNYGLVKPNVLSLFGLMLIYAIKLNLFSWGNVAVILPTIAFIVTLMSLIALGFSMPYWGYAVSISVIYLFFNFWLNKRYQSLWYGLTSLVLSKFELLIISKKTTLAICLLIVLGAANSLYWGEFTLLVPIYFYSILFILFLLSKSDLSDFTCYMSNLLMVLLIGAVIGFIYALTGGEALFSIPNEDSRINGFYLSTFSNTYLLGLIRPSGIFDEPGALSFYICMTVALREHLGMNRKISWILMTLGLITTSLAHLVFMTIYWLKTEAVSLRRLVSSVAIAFLAIFLLTIFENPFSTLLGEIVKKFEVVDGVMAGDNRSALIINALKYLDLKVFFFGLDSDCMLNLEPCALKGYFQYGENPFTLLVHRGILLALPYVLVLGYLIKHFIINKNILTLGVFLLLLQRPNLMSYGYAVIIKLYVSALASNKTHHAELKKVKIE